MRTLVVDDNPANRYLLEVILKANGHDVLLAEQGADALEKLRSEHVDLIVSDIMMPTMDGYQLCRECKRDPALESIPFIFVTSAYTDPQDESFARKLGGAGYVRRPVKPADFLALVDGVLREQQASPSSPPPPLATEDASYFAEYSARVAHRLEGKVKELEAETHERERAEAEKRDSEQRYQALVEHASDLVAIIEPDGTIRYVSPAVTRILGYEPMELLNRALVEFVDVEDVPRLREELEAILRNTSSVVSIARWRHKDGSLRSLQASSRACLDDPAIEGIIVNARDVTESEQALADLRASEQRYRTLFEEKQQSEQRILRRVAMEHLITSLSTRLVSATVDQLDEEVRRALCQLGVFSGADRAVIYMVSKDGKSLRRAYGWWHPEVQPARDIEVRDYDSFPWLASRLRERHATYVRRLADLPVEALAAPLAQQGIASFLFAPMMHGDALIGVIAYASAREGPDLEEADLVLMRAVADVFASTLSRREAERVLERTNRALRMLSICNAAIIHATDEVSLLDEICRMIVDVGGYRSASASLSPSHDDASVKPVRYATTKADCSAERPSSTIELALVDQSRTFGRLTIDGDAAGAFDEVELRLLDELAEEVSFGLTSLHTRAERDRSVAERRLADEKLRRSLEESIQAIAATVESRDPFTAGHQRRVALLCIQIGRKLGLSEERLHGLRLAAAIHDLGKIQIPADILNRPGTLDPLEYELVKCHSQIGHDIIKDVQLPWDIAEMIWQHHEHIDGTGYPRGLQGEQLSLEARILAVADAAEAMTSHRPYRPALKTPVAIDELERRRGSQFDADAVDACVEVLRERGPPRD